MNLRQTLGISAAFAVALHLAGCERPAPSPASDEPRQMPVAVAPETATVAPESSVTPSPPPPLLMPPVPPPGTPRLDPAPPAPPPPSAFDTMRDPAAVLTRWGAAIERRDWATVRALWGNHGADSGLAPKAFAAKWEALRHPRVTVGAGDQEGAAGSIYYTAPVTINDGARRMAGIVTLRRVNDVPGATAEQLRWHLDATTRAPWLEP